MIDREAIETCVRCGKELDPSRDPAAPLLKRCAACFTERPHQRGLIDQPLSWD